MPKTRKTLRRKQVPVSPYCRTIRLRLYPTAKQARQLRRFQGAARHVWNWALGFCKEARAAGARLPSGHDLSRALTAYKAEPGRAWLAEIPADMLHQTVRDFALALAAWRSGLSKFPKPRKHGRARGLRFALPDQRKGEARKGPTPRINLAGRRITLSRIGPVRWRGSRDRLPEGDIAMADVCERAGRWSVTLLERDTKAPAIETPSREAIGVDLGLRDAVVTSAGYKVAAPKPLEDSRKRLARYQRGQARQRDAAMRRAGLDPSKPIPKGTRFVRKGWSRRGHWTGGPVVELSNRALRTEARIARLRAKVAAQRLDFQHQLTHRLTRDHVALAIEDLHVAGMARGLRRAFRRRVADVGLGTIRRQLVYKAGWRHRVLSVVGRWYPSTKICSSCGHRHAELVLKDRHWRCPVCGMHHDRDRNAAKNIKREGLRLLAETEVTSTARSAAQCSRGSRARSAPGPVGTDARGEDACAASKTTPAGQPTSTNRELICRAERRSPRHAESSPAGEGGG